MLRIIRSLAAAGSKVPLLNLCTTLCHLTLLLLLLLQVKWMQEIPADQRPPLLISHALTEGKVIDPTKIVGTGNHARAHPLYSGWNIMTMLSLRLAQGRNGIYYCANWTTPGNTHDMSLLSGIVTAHAIGADYPFPEVCVNCCARAPLIWLFLFFSGSRGAQSEWR